MSKVERFRNGKCKRWRDEKKDPVRKHDLFYVINYYDDNFDFDYSNRYGKMDTISLIFQVAVSSLFDKEKLEYHTLKKSGFLL